MRVLVSALVSIALISFFAQSAEARHRGYSGHAHHRHGYHHGYHHHRYHGHGRSRGGGASLGAVYAPLAAKAREIVGACGGQIVSGFRPHARVRGTGRVSEHASGHAVDISGSSSCIYSHLRGWRGGYSVDPWIGHVHVSLGGREDGARFVHDSGRHRHHGYYARRHRGHHHRYVRR